MFYWIIACVRNSQTTNMTCHRPHLLVNEGSGANRTLSDCGDMTIQKKKANLLGLAFSILVGTPRVELGTNGYWFV